MISLRASKPPADVGPADVGKTDVGAARIGPAEISLRIGGTLIGIALAIATAVWEAVLTTWYVIISGHVIRLPVAPLLAVVCNIALFWFIRKVTGKASLAIFPALAWLAIMVIAGNVTADGDLIVSGTWVGITTILLGTAGWAIPSYRAILKQQSAAPVPASSKVSQVTKPGSATTGPKTPGLKAPGPKTPGPKAPGPKTPGPTTKTPGPAAPKPAGAGSAGPKNKRR